MSPSHPCQPVFVLCFAVEHKGLLSALKVSPEEDLDRAALHQRGLEIGLFCGAAGKDFPGHMHRGILSSSGTMY